MPNIDWSSCAYKSTGVKDNPVALDPLGAASLNCVPMVVEVVVFWALIFAGIVALFLIIFAGYKFLTSGGDPKSIEGARKTLTYGFLGLILILLSFLIINIIATVTGVECIKNFNFGSCG